MSLQEMAAQIPQLSFEERKKLIEMLQASLREEPQANVYRGVTVEEVRGIIKPKEELPPDFNWKEFKEQYLLEKYS